MTFVFRLFVSFRLFIVAKQIEKKSQFNSIFMLRKVELALNT